MLSRLVPSLKCMKLACQVLHGHFEPVYLPQVDKNDGEKRCFFRNQEWSFRRDFNHYASSDIKLCVKKIWQCAKIIRNNCSECRAIFKVHSHTQYIEAKQRAWSESSHTFSLLFRRDFSLRTGKKAKFHMYITMEPNILWGRIKFSTPMI